jgi:hypothetical protein
MARKLSPECIVKLLQGNATCAQKPNQYVVATTLEFLILTRCEELAVRTQEPLELLFIIHSQLAAQKRADPFLESREVAQSLTVLVGFIKPYYAILVGNIPNPLNFAIDICPTKALYKDDAPTGRE